ncbi:hypothetical protein GDO86_016147 [Hymenochirus boettgeri]|nr:hypothetical protein GDO86_016147 [Hymenochirus boettgeri]
MPSLKDYSLIGSQELPTYDSHGLLSSDSGIEMTPAECSEVNKILAGTVEEVKIESYKYIDVTRSPDINPQHILDQGKDFEENKQKCDNIMKTCQKDNYNGNISEDLAYLPYMEEKYDDFIYKAPTFSETKVAPVKITFTGTETTVNLDFPETLHDTLHKGLKPSPDMVPTVTVSEPEDDSPESITPPSTDTDGYTEPSGSEKPSKYRISEEELFNAMNMKERKNDQQSFHVEKKDRTITAIPVLSPLDNEVSSADSGDSEIELVSEDQLGAEEAMQSAYMTFSHIGGPPPSPASPSIQYSILREEREAELDSELIIESCDGSSASEESPKRDQDSPMMKPIIMDIIEEENISRTESFDTSDFESCSLRERKLNMENLAESAAYLKGAHCSDIKADMPVIKKEEIILQKKTEDICQTVELLYWRDLKQSGIVFGSVLLMLFSLTQFSVVSVIAYLALAALSATISFRIYKSVLQAVQKTDEGHPFKSYLDMEISLSQEQIQKYTDCLQAYTNRHCERFAVLMWLLTYVGALFNGLTLLIMAVVSMFTLPAVYDKYQAQIDQYLGLVRTNMNIIVTKIQAKIPGTKQKE